MPRVCDDPGLLPRAARTVDLPAERDGRVTAHRLPRGGPRGHGPGRRSRATVDSRSRPGRGPGAQQEGRRPGGGRCWPLVHYNDERRLAPAPRAAARRLRDHRQDRPRPPSPDPRRASTDPEPPNALPAASCPVSSGCRVRAAAEPSAPFRPPRYRRARLGLHASTSTAPWAPLVGLATDAGQRLPRSAPHRPPSSGGRPQGPCWPCRAAFGCAWCGMLGLLVRALVLREATGDVIWRW